jgi:phage baseplate assembly protein W
MAALVTGFAFPFRIDSTGGVATAYDRDKIRQNILLILGTRLGERPMLRSFGTRLPALVHEPNDSVLADIIQTQAREALMQWEPRILVTTTNVEQNEGTLTLRVNFVYLTEPLADSLSAPLG